MLEDLRHALRLIHRNPGFALTVCLMLTLGIGVNVAVFAVVDVALLRPLPYKDPERLVQLETRGRTYGYRRAGVWGECQTDVRSLTQVFDSVEPYGIASEPTALKGPEFAERVWVGRLSPGVLSTLGITPEIGRGFTHDDAVGGGVVMIGDLFWRRAFGRDPGVVGQSLVLGGRAYTVIGVVPPTLRYAVGPPLFRTLEKGTPVSAALDHEAWLPFDGHAGGPETSSESSWSGGVLARLGPGLTISQARRESSVAVKRLREAKPSAWQKVDLEIVALGHYQYPPPRDALTAVSGAVLFVLLIAYANVASLFLYRTLTREQEVGIRASLGATRGRLVRQFLIEGLVLASMSGLAATLVAEWIVGALPVLAPFSVRWLFAAHTPQLDFRVLAFAVLVTLSAGAVCAAAPALRTARVLARSLRGGQFVVGATRDRRTVTRALQAVQVALTLVLVAGLAVLLASFIRIVRADMGFKVDHLAFAHITTTTGRSARPQNAVLEDILRRVKTLPGVRAATLAPNPASGYFSSRVSAEASPNDQTLVALTSVPPDYFTIAGVSLLEGRMFHPDDAVGPALAIVSQAMARHFWPGRTAVGQRFRQAAGDWITVVGVAGNVRTSNFTTPGAVSLQGWLALRERDNRPPALLIRTSDDSKSVLATLLAIVKAVDPGCEVRRSGDVADLYEGALAPARYYVLLASLLAATGLLTTGAGLYGLVSFAVSQRTREIGLRIALGASPARVRRLVIAEATEPVALGMIVGLLGAFWLMPFLRDVTYQTTANEPRALVAAAAVISAAALLAVVPALRRATRIQPATALRAE